MSDEDYIDKKLPGRIYFSKEIRVQSAQGEKAGRYASRVFEAVDRTHFAQVENETVLRTTQSGREQVKAFFTVDDRKLRTLTVQRFTAGTGRPHEQAHFCLRGEEIEKLLELALLVRTSEFTGQGKVRLGEADLEQFTLTKGAARALLRSDLHLITEIVEQDITERDIVAVAFRRRQLERFERLLGDEQYFESERKKLQCRGDEPVWQRFFEANQWIFGYGLFYVFTSGFDESRLEQVVAGYQVGASGKRADALLRTRGVVSSLCFVEIKTHRTPLLAERPYRPDAWAPSTELSGAVAQSQKTVESAERALGRRLFGRDDLGNPTGDSAFLIHPRSVLVVGSLQQLVSETGVNEPKVTGFELFRRQLVAPEIITFDELHQRAKFIVEAAVQVSG